MSAAILLAEATLLPSGVDLSIFSILINSIATQEMLVQVVAFVPLFYMCISSYYSLFKIGMLTFYSFTPRHTSSVSLLMICSMVARYAPPVSFNFLNLISLDGEKTTIFEKVRPFDFFKKIHLTDTLLLQRMGNIDNAVPFFGKGFNKLYPLLMVVYTLLVASGFFHRIIKVSGIWKRILLQNEVDELDGVDPTGLLILKKERAWLEQGHNIGGERIPLARNFNDADIDIESGNVSMGRDGLRMKPTSSLLNVNKKENQRYNRSREAISSKYAAAFQSRQASNTNLASAKVSLLDSTTNGSSSSLISSTWLSMKSGFHNLKATKNKYAPLHDSSDEVFEKLRRPHRDENELELYGNELDR